MKKELLSVIITSMFSQVIASDDILIEFGKDGESTIDYDSIFSTWDNAIEFENPCYVYGTTPEYLRIPNGSVLNYSGDTSFGRVVMKSLVFNKAENPLKITHTALVVNFNPKLLYEDVSNLLERGMSEEGEKAIKDLIEELNTSYHDIISAASTPDILVPFVFESWIPCVQIHTLQNYLNNDGNIYIRQLNMHVSTDETMDFFKEYIGRSYESLETLPEMISAIGGHNKEERSGKVFCSELVALFFKQIGIIGSDILANNVVPHMLCSKAGEYDVLKGKALPDIPLKIREEKTSCGQKFRSLFSCNLC